MLEKKWPAVFESGGAASFSFWELSCVIYWQVAWKHLAAIQSDKMGLVSSQW